MNGRNKLLVAGLAFAAVACLVVASLAFYYLVYLERISGKVLIVQADSHVNKMALVRVVAIRKEDALIWRSNVARDFHTLLEERRALAAEHEKALAALEAGHDRLIAQQQALLAKYRELQEIAHRIWLVDAGDAAAKRRFFSLVAESPTPEMRVAESLAMSSEWQMVHTSIKRDTVPAAETRLAELVDERKAALAACVDAHRRDDFAIAARIRNFLSIDRLSTLPDDIKVVAADRTDDSGEFVLRLPRGEYYVMARAGRNVFNDYERYFWAHPVSVPSQEASKCLLGNMNLVGSGENDLWQELATQLGRQIESK